MASLALLSAWTVRIDESASLEIVPAFVYAAFSYLFIRSLVASISPDESMPSSGTTAMQTRATFQ